MRFARALCFAASFLAAAGLSANTYPVTTTADSGAGSLRQAITDANANAGADTIAFNIPGSGVQTITPASPFPTITDPVVIDGYTQTGSSANTNAPDQGTNAVILIEINGVHTGGSFGQGALVFGAGSQGSVARGLAINRSASAGIQVNASNIAIQGNFLGTDPTGMIAEGNGGYGVGVDSPAANVIIGGLTPADRNVLSGNQLTGINFGGTGHVVQGNLIGPNAAGTASLSDLQTGIGFPSSVSGVTVGGTVPAARNIISGNSGRGIILSNSLGNPSVTNNVIEGNFIGTDVTGTLPLGNGQGIGAYGIGNTIGGSAAGAGNVIAASANAGIEIQGGNDTVIQGNFIGTDLTGTLALGNRPQGISIGANNVTVGGTAPGAGNVIAFNGFGPFGGIDVYSASGSSIRGNAMHGNAFLGLDLGANGVTPNDSGDADTGPNGLQNYPIVTTVTPGASTTNVQGILNSTASTTFDVDLYSTAPCIPFPQGYLQGENYLDSFQVTTDGSGNATFSHDVPIVLQPGQLVTATATDPNGNTSEFSQRIVFSQSPRSGPPAGGTAATLTGMLFENGATVTVGGVAATGVAVNGSTSITATMPARPAGSLNDVAVSNPSGVAGTLRNGWIADFGDTPGSQQFYSFITKLVANQITVGCGGGNYCPDANVTRQQMAVFLLKGKHGLCYVPPACTSGFFDDVACPSTYAAWIQALATEGITGGCGGNNYCPTNAVRRDQMAVFLLKAEHGSTYVPPVCTGTFLDVPCPSTFANWIERLAAENITGGCGGSNYCPTNPNNRGQMAVFITKTFNLQ